MEEGRKLVHEKLVPDLSRRGIVPRLSKAAVSQLLRTRQTAEEAGFLPGRTADYACLNEVKHGMNGADLRRLLDSGGIPDAAMRAAAEILKRPPKEGIWVSHGLVIAGLCKTLGIDQNYERLVPRFCEVRKLPI